MITKSTTFVHKGFEVQEDKSTDRAVFQLHPRYQLDTGFYDKVRASRSSYELVNQLTVPPNEGRGFLVEKGQTFRVVEQEGPQIGDIGLWNVHDPKEAFHAEYTFLLEGWWIRPYTRLWSYVPWLRPLATCVEGTVVLRPPKRDFHHHLVISGHCSPEFHELRSGRSGLNACHINLLQAIEPFGLREEHIYDNINVHQKERIDPKNGRLYIAASDGKPGDYIEFYAEIDLLVGVSICSTGDGIKSGSFPEDVTLRPLGVEVYKTGIKPQEFPTHKDWRPGWKGKWTP